MAVRRYNLRNKGVAPDLVYQVEALITAVDSLSNGHATPAAALAGSSFTQAQLAELTGLFGAFAQVPIGTSATDPLLVQVGSGTVTSVGATGPTSFFTWTNTPVTSTGTLTAALNTQSANIVFAGPASGAAAVPTFRALTAADITGIGATLLASTVLDLNTNTKQTLYTVPAGKSALPVYLILRSSSTNLSGGATTTLQFGFNAGATDWTAGAPTNITSLTGATLYNLVQGGGGPSVVGTAAQTFGAIADFSFGSAANVTVDVFGYTFP